MLTFTPRPERGQWLVPPLMWYEEAPPTADAPSRAEGYLTSARRLSAGERVVNESVSDSGGDESAEEIFNASRLAHRPEGNLRSDATSAAQLECDNAADTSGRSHSTSSDALLREALLGHASRVLYAPQALPSETTFERVLGTGTSVPLQVEGVFATHTSYELPSSSPPHELDVIHRFTLLRTLSEPLNAKLVAWAIERERLGRASLEKPGPGSDAGVAKTNRGGYQTFADLFSGQEDSARHRAFKPCRTVHAVASAAMDELGSAQYLDVEETERPMPGEPHAAYAWASVNRPTDHNIM